MTHFLLQACQDRPLQIMASHSPLSAKLAAEARFDGLWASGFELSALFGLPDVSMITMTDHIQMMQRIARATDIPIIADIDTGFGNAVNVVHAIKEYEASGASAIVIEDKSFPKVTSLVDGGRQDLLPVPEFQGKIEAAVATRQKMLVIARVEALIAGLGEEEAIERGHAYADAGADMILIHSKQKTPAEILSFIAAWDGRIPLVLVPTSYPELSVAEIAMTGKIGMIIWGNHAIRSSVKAMQDTFARIKKDASIHSSEDKIATVQEVFRLQNMHEVNALEARFLK